MFAFPTPSIPGTLLPPSSDTLMQAVIIASWDRRGELPVALRGRGAWEEGLGCGSPWGMGGGRLESLRPRVLRPYAFGWRKLI